MSTGFYVTQLQVNHVNDLYYKSKRVVVDTVLKPPLVLNGKGQFVNGFLANLGMTLVMQPAFTIKTHIMSGTSLPSLASRQILRYLYRGLVANSISAGTAEGVAFFTQHFFTQSQKNVNATTEFTISLAAGAISAPINTICERVMVLQQIRGGTMISVLRPLITKSLNAKNKSAQIQLVRELFKGIVPTMYRDALFNCGIFALHSNVKRNIQPHFSKEYTASAIAGVISGLIAGVLSCPFDLAKTVMQTDIEDQYISMTKTLKFLYRTGGLKNGLFKGAGIRAFLIGGAVVLIDLFKVKVPNYLPHTFVADVTDL